jgi:hypothetical protein
LKPAVEQLSRIRSDGADPRSCYQQWRGDLTRAEGILLVDFTLRQYWLERADPVGLTAIYHLSTDGLRVSVTDQPVELGNLPPQQQYQRLVRRYGLAEFDPQLPLQLLPEPIVKPWGQEIWYSAVEPRGVCQFGQQQACTPIPWLQAVVPDALIGSPGEDLLLLKILDPLPDPVLGDLYFELHEHKREVYVVTHVDPRAWPDGVGRIRYGFDRAQLERSGSEASFRAAYLASVQAYEAVRRSLDRVPAGQRPGVEQIQREQALREQMDSFTHLHPVTVGDVISVPARLPHSLQHGVRVIEFQTPVYERKILSFGQRVVTQDHWDTAEAVNQMCLEPGAPQPCFCLYQAHGVKVEQIARFTDFEVRRVVIREGGSWWLDCPASYALLMVVTGVLRVGGVSYRAEQALLLPANWSGQLAPAGTVQPLVFLVATAGS